MAWEDYSKLIFRILKPVSPRCRKKCITMTMPFPDSLKPFKKSATLPWNLESIPMEWVEGFKHGPRPKKETLLSRTSGTMALETCNNNPFLMKWLPLKEENEILKPKKVRSNMIRCIGLFPRPA